MRIAVVFDDLIQFGGAERLLLAVHELYPHAPVFTSVASDEWLRRSADLKIALVTSFMQRLPFKKSLNRFYGLLGLHALAFESFKFDDFDVVLSISARFAHSVITKPGTTHICYMNSPGRMFWESREYFEQEGFLSNDFIKKLWWFFSVPLLSFRRQFDYASAQRVDYFIANSRVSQDRIGKYYRRDSTIIYPFVDNLVVGWADMSTERSPHPAVAGEAPVRGHVAHPYFLAVTRLNAWKRVDIAIDACKKVGANLKIIGEGPDKKRLKNLVGWDNEKIKFLGYVSEREKVSEVLGCKALIITQKEDFGITALEAMSLGRPVIAYKKGGALETVIEGVTGEFFAEQNAGALAKVLRAFNASLYKPGDCKDQAAKFSKQRFTQELDDFVKKVYHSKDNLF